MKKSADNSILKTIRKLAKYMNCSMDYLAYENCEINFVDNINFQQYGLKELINNDYDNRNFDEFVYNYKGINNIFISISYS